MKDGHVLVDTNGSPVNLCVAFVNKKCIIYCFCCFYCFVFINLQSVLYFLNGVENFFYHA